MDWVWFYSTLSQCSAAIVGFLGAFTISKLITFENDYTITVNEIKILKSKIISQKKLLKLRSFDALIKKTRELEFEKPEFKAAVKELAVKGMCDEKELIDCCSFSKYDNMQELKQAVRAEYESFTKPTKTLDLKNPEILEAPRGDANKLSDSFTKLRTLQYESTSKTINENEFEHERELIEKEVINTQNLAEEVKRLIGRMLTVPNNRRIIQLIIFIIAVLFLVGVLVPLLRLPYTATYDFIADVFSFKGILLCMVSMAFLTLCVVLFARTFPLKISNEDANVLQKYQDVGEYSPYLRNMVENEKLIHEEITL